MRVGIATATETSENYSQQFLHVSHSRRSVYSDDRAVKVELVGELALTQQPASLANKILLEPVSPADSAIVRDHNEDYQMLVEREMLSMDGSECNKIGTSYAAFNNQPGDRC